MRFIVVLGLLALAACASGKPLIDDTPPRVVSVGPVEQAPLSPLQGQARGQTVAEQAAASAHPVPLRANREQRTPVQPAQARPVQAQPQTVAQQAAQRPAQTPVPQPTTVRKAQPSEPQWYPWFASKANMSLGEFNKALEEGDTSKVPVGPQAYIDDLKQIHHVPVGDTTQSLVAFLRSADIEVIPCTKEILAKNVMGARSKDSTRRQYKYRRKNCYQGEQLVRHIPTGRILFSLGCGNVLKPDTPTERTGGDMPAVICEVCS